MTLIRIDGPAETKHYGLEVATPPAVEPVSLPEAKDHLRVSISDDDTLISGLIVGARRWCEGFRNESFITQTLELTLDEWPDDGVIELPRGPVQSVTSVEYTDEDGNTSTFAASNYVVSTASNPGRLALKRSASWPSDTLQELEAIKVTYPAGYGDSADDVPEEVKSAIKLLVGHLYENREHVIIGSGLLVTDVPLGVESLLWMERTKGFG